MRWLVRRVLKQGKGSVSYEEDVHFGDVLSIGRAADQAIFLPDLRAALNHARVTASGTGRYHVESLILAGIRVNGQLTYAINVGAGAMIEVGGTRLTLLDPPRDFDAAVEVSALDKAEQAAVKAQRAKPTSLRQTWLGKRMPSWLLFVLILVFGLVVPAASHYSAALRGSLAHAPLPSTVSWNPGPLDSAHRYFGNDCMRCHETPFRQVRDTACVSCHTSIAAHADPARFNLPQLGEAQCSSCHQDHLGLRGMVRTRQTLCGDCHRGLQKRTNGASELADATDFGRDHPEFHVLLPAWDAQDRFTPQRVPLDPPPKELSGIRFNHAQHLEPDLSSPSGTRTLTCASCHQADAGGLAMQPVKFETMCHDCHTLGFDSRAPDRQVPHAKVAEVAYMLDDYYSRLALEGGYDDPDAPPVVQLRRRPGDPPLSRQQQVEAISWAREQSRKVAESVFTGRACVTCHDVTPPRGDRGWRIAPVRVAGHWYGDAKFTHARHSTMQCGDCHTAATSTTASDVLIPGIANCRECHSGEGGSGKVASTCIVCHDFHQSKTLKLRQL